MRWISMVDEAIRRAEAFILIAGILLIALNSIANVLGRYLFSQSIYFSEELNYFLIIAVTFSGSSYAARQSRHISMSAFLDMLKGKQRALATAIINFVTCAMLALLTWYAVEYLMKVGRMGRLSPAMQVPLHYVYAVVPVGLAFTSVQFFRHGIDSILVFLGKKAPPQIHTEVEEVQGGHNNQDRER
ncbi:TRAP transporter small permease [Parasalinivibrio latis]|uniref:TRAP transporter small permease n=1 Tax=Parasalinivibrio latis TaxID=2952610 RepID=UPI0030E2B430